MLLIAAIMLTLIQASPVRNQIPNLNLIDPNSSQQFFETGREQLEEEIKLLQMEGMPSEDFLQLEVEPGKMISVQGIQGWCVDSEDNLILTGSYQPDVMTEKGNPIIPGCH